MLRHVGRDQVPNDFGFEHLGGGDEYLDVENDDDFRDCQRAQGVDPDDAGIEDPITADYGNESEFVAGTATVPARAAPGSYFADRAVEDLERVADADDPTRAWTREVLGDAERR